MGDLDRTMIDYELAGNDFIRSVVKLIFDQAGIVGNGEHIKANHEKIITLKYPNEIEKMFDYQIGKSPESFPNLLDICRKTISHSLKTVHPTFMNSLFGGVDQFGLAGSWLTEALNGSMATWELSPVFTVMEKHVINFMGQMAGFKNVEGLFCPGGSMANCYSMLLARHRMFPTLKEDGIVGLSHKLVMFVSDQAHYSFSKMAIMLGHGSKSVIKVRTDEMGRMIPDELEKAIIKANEQKLTPFMIAATTGTTVFGSFDPLLPIATICRKNHLWFHVDGALGGTWLLSRKHRHLLNGLEQADSFTWDFHKMLSVPVYCSMILVNNHRNIFTEAFGLNAQYLFQENKFYDKKYDAGDKSIQCIRKIEAFKLFLFMKAHGLDRIEQMVDNVYELSRYFERKIAERPNFQLIFPQSQSNNICFRFIPDLYLNNFNLLTSGQHLKVCTELKRRMMENGSMMVAYQEISEKQIPACFRLAISAQPVRTAQDIDFIVENFEILGKNIVLE